MLARDLPHGRYRALRSLVDSALAALALVLLAPVLVAIVLLIRLDSPGPALFRQQRVGRYRRPFTISKFRTMVVTAPQYSLKVADSDPKITTVGHFLRRTGLDELPQLMNVVKGDMALIGPRPEQLGLASLYEPWQQARMLIKPGITGWWQVRHRDGSPLHLNVDKDLYYIANQSARLDLEIVRETLAIILRGLVPARFRESAREAKRVGDTAV